MPRIDSSDNEIEEITVLPFKSSSGRVVKPSAALLDLSNTAKVPGQPHSTRNDPKESEGEPKKKKAKSKASGKQNNKEVPVPDVPGVCMGTAVQPANLVVSVPAVQPAS
jgi:hypothetical protein